jgi:lysozyme family protein
MSVNMGIKRAVTLCQIAINDIGEHCNVDGKWGPATESTVNGSDASALLPEIRASQSHYYTNLVAQRPELYQFLRGWLRRVQSC